MEWLGSVGRDSEPKLLYRASRDGWEAKDFHDKCDGKGATVVLVKSDDGGYVFGGYTDVPWSSPSFDAYKYSSESFLFSLKCYDGLPAVKMGIKAGEEGKAVYHSSSRGPIFGGGSDLGIGSPADAETLSRSAVGKAYHRPAGTTVFHFLTGPRNFNVTDYEVFQV